MIFNTLYKSNVVEKHPSPTGGFGFFSTQKIQKGTLLLIENIQVDSQKNLANLLFHNPIYSSLLHPRSSQPSTISSCMDKVDKNCFNTNNDDVLLGITISTFNHSCKCNSMTKRIHKVLNDGTFINLILVYALVDINENNELFICYSPKMGHLSSKNNIFHCPCLVPLDMRISLFEANTELVDFLFEESAGFVRLLLDSYVNSVAQIKCAVLTKLLKKGIVFDGNEFFGAGGDDVDKVVGFVFEEYILLLVDEGVSNDIISSAFKSFN